MRILSQPIESKHQEFEDISEKNLFNLKEIEDEDFLLDEKITNQYKKFSETPTPTQDISYLNNKSENNNVNFGKNEGNLNALKINEFNEIKENSLIHDNDEFVLNSSNHEGI